MDGEVIVGVTAECRGWDCGGNGDGGDGGDGGSSISSVGLAAGLTTSVTGSVERAAVELLRDDSIEGRLADFREELSNASESTCELFGVEDVRGDDSVITVGSNSGTGEHSNDGDFLNFFSGLNLTTRTVSSLFSKWFEAFGGELLSFVMDGCSFQMVSANGRFRRFRGGEAPSLVVSRLRFPTEEPVLISKGEACFQGISIPLIRPLCNSSTHGEREADTTNLLITSPLVR